MNIYLAVACHKKYDSFPSDHIYHVVEVGSSKRNEHFYDLRDDCGKDNISSKNYSYCELTALYWVWKNCDFDYLGLCHYRRYFSNSRSRLFSRGIKDVITEKTILSLLSKRRFIVPVVTKMNKTVYQHSIAHYDDHHMDITRDVISKYYPNYLPAFDAVMNSKKAHFFNMFATSKNDADNYLTWLFDVLQKVEDRYIFDCPDPRSVRVFGYIAESLLDVYLLANDIEFFERGVIYLERPSLFKRIKNKVLKLFQKRN